MAAQMQIKITSDGSIILDGKSASIDKLDQQLAALAAQKGTVCYYRQENNAKSLATGRQVVDLVVKHEVPLFISPNADFSDAKEIIAKPRPGRNSK